MGTLLSNETARAFSDLFLDCSIKSLLLLGIGLVVDFCAERASASARHLFWTLCVVVLLLLPLMTGVMPARVVLPFERTSSLAAPAEIRGTAAVHPSPSVTSRVAIQEATSQANGPQEKSGFTVNAFNRGSRALFVLYLLGFVATMARISWAQLFLHRIRMRSLPCGLDRWNYLCGTVRGAIGYTGSVELRTADQISIPFVFGTFRPVLMIPGEAANWSSDRIRAVLIHEISHLIRRDCWVQSGALLASALYWFNPLIWLASGRLKMNQEKACDDMALRHQFKPSDYAGHLLEISKEAGFYNHIGAFAFIGGSDLCTRLKAILDPRQAHTKASPAHKAGLLAIFLSVMIGLLPFRLVAYSMRPNLSEKQRATEQTVDSQRKPAAQSSKPLSGTPSNVETNIRMLSSPSPDARGLAACNLGEMSPPAVSAIPALVSLLADRAPIAIVHCSDRGNWKDEEDPGSSPGREAAMSLGSLSAPAVVPLLQALQSPDWSTRGYACYALAVSGEPRAVQPILELLHDGNAVVRESAAFALGALNDSRAVTPLIGSLKDDEPRVRRWAAWALGALNDSRAVEPLIPSLKDENASVRQWSAWALGALNDSRAVEPLIPSLKDENANVRQWAAWALGTLNDARARKALISAAQDSNSEVRTSARHALSVLEGKPE